MIRFCLAGGVVSLIVMVLFAIADMAVDGQRQAAFETGADTTARPGHPGVPTEPEASLRMLGRENPYAGEFQGVMQAQSVIAMGADDLRPRHDRLRGARRAGRSQATGGRHVLVFPGHCQRRPPCSTALARPSGRAGPDWGRRAATSVRR